MESDRGTGKTPSVLGPINAGIHKRPYATPRRSKGSRFGTTKLSSSIASDLSIHEDNVEEEGADLEGPTLLEDEDEEDPEGLRNFDDNDDTLLDQGAEQEQEEEEEEYPSTLTNDQADINVDWKHERERRLSELEDLFQAQDFSVGERELIAKLDMRGLEPLLPATWTMDFRTLPSNLFVDNVNFPNDRPLIEALGLSNAPEAQFYRTCHDSFEFRGNRPIILYPYYFC